MQSPLSFPSLSYHTLQTQETPHYWSRRGSCAYRQNKTWLTELYIQKSTFGFRSGGQSTVLLNVHIWHYLRCAEADGIEAVKWWQRLPSLSTHGFHFAVWGGSALALHCDGERMQTLLCQGDGLLAPFSLLLPPGHIYLQRRWRNCMTMRPPKKSI